MSTTATVPTTTPATVPVVSPDQTARFSDADWSRVATLVATGLPRGHALAVVQQQRDARMSDRPAGRVVSRSDVRARETVVGFDSDGAPIVRAVKVRPHQAYRVVGSTGVGSSALAVPTTAPDASALRAVEAFRASGRPSALAVARAALGA